MQLLKPLLLLCVMMTLSSYSLNASNPSPNVNKRSDISLKFEVKHAIEKGLDWLKENQHEDGYWSQPGYPALTGLVLTGFMGHPNAKYNFRDKFIQNGYAYMIQSIKPDGGIYVEGLANYNTAVSVVALQVSKNPEYISIIKKARNFLVSLQHQSDDVFSGGIGYGGRYEHSDLSNMVLALEALYYTKNIENSPDQLNTKELDWQAAIQFVQQCQNLPEANDQLWVTGDSFNKGGFVYFPGESKAGEMKLKDGRTTLRSYGSMSYAGLLSYIYVEMDKEDSRVLGVYEWLRRNFTVEENPGLGAQGLFYYYHTMAKALSLYGAHILELENGKKVNWRNDLSLKLLDLQDGKGYWMNSNGRWWEKDPVLVTSYAVMTLEIIYRGL